MLTRDTIAGLLLYFTRSTASMFSKGGRGKGLFGNVTSSTAKLINPNEIGVRFKLV